MCSLVSLCFLPSTHTDYLSPPFPCSVCALKFGSIMRFVAAQTKHDCDTHPSVAMGAHMSLALNCKGGAGGRRREEVQEQDWRGGGDSCLRQMPSRLPCPVIICRIHTARDAMPPLTSNRQAGRQAEGEEEGQRQTSVTPPPPLDFGNQSFSH